MHLAFCLFNYFPYGGLQQDFLQIAKVCLQRGHTVQVFTMQWQGERLTDLPVTLLSIKGFTNHQRSWRFAQQLPVHINAFDKVIGFNKMPGLDIYFAADGCYQAKAAEKNWLYRLTFRCRTYLKLEAAVFNRRNKTHCLLLTPPQLEEYSAAYQTPRERLHLLPPGIAPIFSPPANVSSIRQAIRLEWNVPKDAYLFLMVASYFHTKGVDRSIKALAALPPAIREKAHLFIIGEDNAAPYQRLAESLTLAKQVHFLGARQDVQCWMWAADLLLHPARQEAAGKVLIEAIAAGLPALTVSNCGYASIIQQAKAGSVLSEPFQQGEMNQQLIRLLTQLEQLSRYHKQALQYSKQADIFSMAEHAVDIIEQ